MSKLILFQGDSITDDHRSREFDALTGQGYPTLVKAMLGYDRPGEYRFLNRGISGNRIVDVYARIKKDIINLSPDYMSILIGVNAVWHEVSFQNGVDAEKFKKVYAMLLEEAMEQVPGIQIMILEPFVLKGTATEEAWDYFSTEVPKRAAAARELAEKYNLVFVPLQQRFDDALKLQDWSYWTHDGVHPTAEGHELIKRAWLEGFSSLTT